MGVRHPTLITAALFCATFSAGVAEYVLTGQLDLVADGLGVSEATTGQLVTVFALAYGLATPALVVMTARTERRLLISVALLAFAAANLLCWQRPTLPVLMASRIVMAASTGLIVVTALGLAVQLAPVERRARAMATVMMGVTASLVLAVPAGRAISEQWSWTTIFAIDAALAVLVAVIVWLILPDAGAGAVIVPFRRQLALLANTRTMLGLAVTFLWLGGYAVLNTYLTPYLLDVVELSGPAVSLALLLFGVASLVGIQIGGLLTDRLGPFRTLTTTKALHVIVLIILPALAMSTIGGVLGILLWGTLAWASTAAQQLRVAALAPEASNVLLSLNQSVMQIAIGIGSAAGGVAAARTLAPLPLIAAGVVAASLVLLVLTKRDVHTRPSRSTRRWLSLRPGDQRPERTG
ncbi:MFS transporter [Rhodococcus hoagii]|uniref:MFS transporter n=1 Tax=Rhodococcus hoagii TaxID=43767 RepID=UPI0019628042|nr:MFS transporter [Prescottella equi]MBM9838678.1 MFS transporter [Prescottella equi]NKR65223.1 MFS transporter [Prescottella equi]NKR80749.1 MFS transporter [Prescottella equi]NKS99499.1 MFS transporter [Prescottella equi]